ncbi:hypothetical protein QUF58_08865 [Anaerolineales bacterium HSG24]|nr:hypothetical protein [Anaerolineales bacterium HSG24]
MEHEEVTKSKKKEPKDQYDSPWKKAIEEYFEECIAFFFPKIYADIDWGKEYEFLDKELEKLVRQSAVSKQHVDKLIQVHRKSGEKTLVMLHIDVQSQHETDFAKRMYFYNSRLFERYGKPVATVVIYGDKSKKWQPKKYTRKLWGTELKFKFSSIKLMGYNISELEQSDNLFAVVVLAHRHTQATKHQYQTRYDLRWRLTRMLYERGYSQKQVRSLYNYINWLMTLPEGLESQFNQELEQFEEKQEMPYVISAVRHGIEKGIQQGIQQSEQKILQSEQKVLQIAREDVIEVLMIRLGELPKQLVKTIKQIDELVMLKTLLKKSVTVESVALFEQFLIEQLSDDDDDDSSSSKGQNND